MSLRHEMAKHPERFPNGTWKKAEPGRSTIAFLEVRADRSDRPQQLVNVRSRHATLLEMRDIRLCSRHRIQRVPIGRHAPQSLPTSPSNQLPIAVTNYQFQ